MMVQNAPHGEPRFISTMVEHNDLCGQFAAALGNDRFEAVEPRDEMLFVVTHHDRGWDERDADPVLDPKAGVPYGIGGGGPAIDGLIASRRSPDFNERHHPYCGLLSSMHSWGLYNGRYGFSRFSIRGGGSISTPVQPEAEAETAAMLDHELARQARLKALLAADPATRPWVQERHLLQNYKQLQFFDTLALYFHIRHESERGEELYVHVPLTAGEDATIALRPAGDGVYAMNPFPFAGDRLDVVNRGRYLHPFAPGEAPADLAAALYARPAAEQRYTFLPA